MDHPLFTSSGSFFPVVRNLPPNQLDFVWHTIHVNSTAIRIGRRMRLDRYWLKVVHFAAIRHDVGKLRPENQDLFFVYRGEFSTQQRLQASSHPRESAEIIIEKWYAGQIPNSFEIVAPALVAIRGHHWAFRESEVKYLAFLQSELFKGFAGFCRGHGTFPLLLARILKVSDCYVTAMEERRLWEKPAMNPLEAYEDLCSQKGDKYDPEVVDALWPITKEDMNKFENHSS